MVSPLPRTKPITMARPSRMPTTIPIARSSTRKRQLDAVEQPQVGFERGLGCLDHGVLVLGAHRPLDPMRRDSAACASSVLS